MKIGGWRTRSVFERYAIVSRSDIQDAILKLQATEQAESKKSEAEAEKKQISHSIGHTEAISTSAAVSKAIN